MDRRIHVQSGGDRQALSGLEYSLLARRGERWNVRVTDVPADCLTNAYSQRTGFVLLGVRTTAGLQLRGASSAFVSYVLLIRSLWLLAGNGGRGAYLCFVADIIRPLTTRPGEDGRSFLRDVLRPTVFFIRISPPIFRPFSVLEPLLPSFQNPRIRGGKRPGDLTWATIMAR